MRTLYCIVGPSGSGKTTLEKNIKHELPWLKSVESYTTRKPRYEGETGHRFVSKETFDKLKLVTYTNFAGAEYGTTAEILDDVDLYVIDVVGIQNLKKNYDRPMIVVGLKVDEEVCKQRMKDRGDDDQTIQQRIENDRRMFKNYLDYCDVIIDANGNANNTLAQFIDKVAMFENKLDEDMMYA